MNIQKRSILAASVLLVIIIAGGAAFYFSLAAKDTRTPVKTTPATSKKDTPTGAEAKTFKTEEFTDKEVTVVAFIQESQSNRYVLLDQNTKQPIDTTVDFSKSQDKPQTFIAANVDAAQPPQTAKPVTIAGKLTAGKNSKGPTYRLVVESIKE